MKKFLIVALALSFLLAGCDTPAENATEERVEDAGEAAGMSEDAAEQRGEAVKDGTATAYTATDTTATTVTTGTTGTTATTATTTTTP